MRRTSSLAAVATALLVLLAPLCAVACFDGAPAATAAQAGTAPACHESEPSQTPAAPAGSHDECGCEESIAAFVPGAGDAPTGLAAAALLRPRSDGGLATATSQMSLAAHPASALPPPDILLRKSSLQI